MRKQTDPVIDEDTTITPTATETVGDMILPPQPPKQSTVTKIDKRYFNYASLDLPPRVAQ